MQHSYLKPPNWTKLLEVFDVGDMWDKGLIITWGDRYHCKFRIDPDLIAHEQTHTRQQEAFGGPNLWWERYYVDVPFRLNQEIEAYRNQVKYLRDHPDMMTRDERRDRIKQCARALSSKIYGDVISYEKALSLIR